MVVVLGVVALGLGEVNFPVASNVNGVPESVQLGVPAALLLYIKLQVEEDPLLPAVV